MIRLVLRGMALVALIVAGFWYRKRAEDQRAASLPIHANAARLTLVLDDGRALVSVARRSEPELWYRVMLDEAPLGMSQTLRYAWYDPSGRVVRENEYETRDIDHLPWQTHARYRLRSSDAPGTWRVVLYRRGERLKETSFEVTTE